MNIHILKDTLKSKSLNLLDILSKQKGYMRYVDIRRIDTRNPGVVKKDLNNLVEVGILMKRTEIAKVGKKLSAKKQVEAYAIDYNNQIVKFLFS